MLLPGRTFEYLVDPSYKTTVSACLTAARLLNFVGQQPVMLQHASPQQHYDETRSDAHLATEDVLRSGPVSSSQTVQRFRELTAQPEQGSADLPLLLPAVVSFRLNLAAMAAPDFPMNVSVLGSLAPAARSLEYAIYIS